MITLKSIEEDAADCRAAFVGFVVGSPAWHVHHAVLSEIVTKPIENRILYILINKPEREQALRLRLMRPALTLAPAWVEYGRVKALAWAEYERVKALAWVSRTLCRTFGLGSSIKPPSPLPSRRGCNVLRMARNQDVAQR